MKNYTLALETGIGGGSVALFRERELIDSIGGSGVISRSEDLLDDLALILKRKNISNTKKNLGRLVVSSGPGSHTGLRIGQATAFGLKHGLNLELNIISLFKAQYLVSEIAGEVLSLVRINEQQIAWQIFKDGLPLGEPEQSEKNEFERIIKQKHSNISICANREDCKIFGNYGDEYSEKRIFVASELPAFYIGRAYLDFNGSDNINT